MAKYLFIESRDSFESNDVGQFRVLAKSLADDGNEVAVFLVQNGVLPARLGAKADGLARLAEAGVDVLADDFSLRERAIPVDALMRGVSPASIGVVIDRLAEGWKVVWH